jgi:GT2 family glycosyltransferase
MARPPVDKVVGLKLTNLDGSLEETAHLRLPSRVDFLKEQFRFAGPARDAADSAHLLAATSAEKVGFVSGAALAFNRNVVDRIGNLDPKMFWAEDLDFCVRAHRAGIPVYFLPQAGALHYGGESGKKNLRRMIYAQHVSRVNFARKHYGVLTEIVTRIALGSILPLKMIARARDLFTPASRDDARQRMAGYRDALKYCLTRIQISAG